MRSDVRQRATLRSARQGLDRKRDAGPMASAENGMDVDLVRAGALLAAARRVVVLTGAGISTDSGIPDYRGPNGVWTRNPGAEKAATLSHYVDDPEVRRAAWRTRLASPAWTARPNAGHHALVALERQGRLHTLITQNVDALHHAAGNDPDRIVEVHGTIRRWSCLACGATGPMEEALERVRAGEEDPACLVALPDGSTCGGIVKSATISFGQNLVAADLERAMAAASSCDLLLAVGSTLGVYPVAQAVPVAHQHGARLIIVNAQPTPFDPIADVVVRTPIGEALPAMVALAGGAEG
jgi:NAD-dependent deacetylase